MRLLHLLLIPLVILSGAPASMKSFASTRLEANQAPDASGVRARLNDPKPLTADEIGQVLEAARREVAGKTFRVSVGRSPSGIELLFGTGGRVGFLRTTTNNAVDLTEYTGRPAQYCEGTAAPGELVIEYHRAGGGWVVNARHSTPMEVLSPVYSLLTGTTTLNDGGLTLDRAGRALTAPWKPVEYSSTEKLPNGAVISRSVQSGPIDATQALVIDRTSLLPIRWEIVIQSPAGLNVPGPIPLSYSIEHVPTPTGELRRPDAVSPPDCIPVGIPPRPPGGFPGR